MRVQARGCKLKHWLRLQLFIGIEGKSRYKESNKAGAGKESKVIDEIIGSIIRLCHHF